MVSRSAYRGSQRKLVIAFDFGTTYSGISYSVLDPGKVPEIKGVTRFPANEQISGASKIPTIIYYDRDGRVQAVGAEAKREGVYEQAEDEEWVKAEWFKLHLRSRAGPRARAGREFGHDIPPLPLNKTVVEVIADFLTYLFECASKYIQDTHMDGVDLWASVNDKIEFVLSQPNGWEGAQQSEMREAAVLAGLIPDTTVGHARLSFVTEGEACLHFAIQNGLPAGAMMNGDGVVIVDAGGGTINISSYRKKTSAAAQIFEEVAAPQCHFYGSVFVNIQARKFLENYLAESHFADDVDHIINCFDGTTKLRFRGTEELQYIKFGSKRDNDAEHNIHLGQVKLLGTDVVTFFQPSIDCIVKAVLDQRQTAHKPISHVILVGGFSANDYLFNKVQAALAPSGLNVVRPQSHVNKAVSDGAISFYLDHFVRSRVSKMTYGSFCDVEYNPHDPEHCKRSADVYTSPNGRRHLPDQFDIILPKDTQVSEEQEFRSFYFQDEASIDNFKKVTCPIWCYRGHLNKPRWKDVDTENYTKLCTIAVDLSNLPLLYPKHIGSGEFYCAEFHIVLLFGLTELKAWVEWKKGKKTHKSKVKIVYDPDTANVTS